jgi:hypothetical protein
MANSITASNAAAPFNSLLLSDANYAVSASYAATSTVSPSVNFQVASPYPTTANTIVYIYTTAQAAGTGSQITVQESADNSTWSNIAIFANPILSGSATTTNTSIILGPNAKQYLRVSASQYSAGTPAGVFGLTVLM